jgi:cellulose synthase/poly-beta-1,6-N-acetylglucosamine synthase-like glycosyltransferase
MLGYIYAGYASVIRLLAWKFPRPVLCSSIRPPLTVVITAYNEEKGIVEKLRNVVQLHYPQELLEIIVASDASTDRTDELVRDFGHSAVRLLRVEGRVGKTACQNAAVREARGEIVVFTDATTAVEADALIHLVDNFADPTVGCVAGCLIYVAAGSTATARGGAMYWDYELKLRRSESTFCSLVGVSGCLYAVRRSAYKNIPADLISDFVVAMVMRESGLRTVLEPRAECYEETLSISKQELSMRVRVALRSLHALWTRREFMNPFRAGVFAWELISHKLLRYLSPLFICVALLVTILASLHSPYFRALLLFEVAVLAIASLGFMFPGFASGGIPGKLYYFLLTNMASVLAIYRYLRGERVVTWKPLR